MRPGRISAGSSELADDAVRGQSRGVWIWYRAQDRLLDELAADDPQEALASSVLPVPGSPHLDADVLIQLGVRQRQLQLISDSMGGTFMTP